MYQNNPANSGIFTTGNVSFGAPSITVGISPLDELSKQIEGSRARIVAASERVREIADTLFGAMPPAGQTERPQPVRSGKVGSLNDQADAVGACVSELENQLARLGTIS